MKTSTLHSLVTAKALFDRLDDLVLSGDRHECSAGLILLQDAFEIVMFALLVEKGVDEQKQLETLTFDQMVSQLRDSGVKVPKSGTLKAMNKMRVITKHYGQLAEPATVQNYYDAVKQACASIVPEVVGMGLDAIFLSELLQPGEAQDVLREAESALRQAQYERCLVEVRKAIFIEIEMSYSIFGWQGVVPGEDLAKGLVALFRGGRKAPYRTKNSKWIEEHVYTPFDFIQIDREELKKDAIEWGVSTAELENVRRLTPAVFRSESAADWQVKIPMSGKDHLTNRANAQYCLDRAISIILHKHRHLAAYKYPTPKREYMHYPGQTGHSLYKKASTNSGVSHVMTTDFVYAVVSQVPGLGKDEIYYEIRGHKEFDDEPGASSWASGYLPIQAFQ